MTAGGNENRTSSRYTELLRESGECDRAACKSGKSRNNHEARPVTRSMLDSCPISRNSILVRSRRSCGLTPGISGSQIYLRSAACPCCAFFLYSSGIAIAIVTIRRASILSQSCLCSFVITLGVNMCFKERFCLFNERRIIKIASYEPQYW
jgi:hypothetical protein